VVEVFPGSEWYVNERYSGPTQFDYPKPWDAYVGHYRTRNPELSNFRVAIRKEQLVLLNPWGNIEPLVPMEDSLFRIGAESLSPETLRFDPAVEGRALRADYSGCPYYRTFTP
jgi:D-alanyl-D-alanine carboxypeptidase